MNKKICSIKKLFTPILKQAGVTKSSLFGSYAQNNDTVESDIDLLIDFPKGKGFFELIELKERLEEACNKKVDLVTYKSISPLIKDNIISSQIVLYEENQ